MNPKDIIKKLDAIKDLPTLPSIAMEVNRLLENHNTSIDILSNAIIKDQAIVSKVLKLVNSAFFGVTSKVSSINDAVVLLGFNAIRNIVIAVSLVKVFSKKTTSEGFDISDFWKHSIAVATTSKYLSQKANIDEPENCFVGGLLHDIGKIILYQFFNEIFNEILLTVKNENLSFYEVEKKISMPNHAKIGGYLAKKWRLPLELIDAVQYHHMISKNTSNIGLVVVVHTANIVVNSYTSDSMCQDINRGKMEKSQKHPCCGKKMNFFIKTANDWYPELSESITEACAFFTESNE